MYFEHLAMLLIIYLTLGGIAGFLSGLFGVGGGLIMVPGLLLVFQFAAINPAIAMHLAVGTSLASIVPLTFRSLIAHLKRGVAFFSIYQQMFLGVLIGVVASGILAHNIHSRTLEILFGLFVLMMGVKLLRDNKLKKPANLPGPIGLSCAGGFVGLLSGMLGIGGSTFLIPFLTHRGVRMHVAIVASVAVAMTVSLVGAITFYFTGLHAFGLPRWTIGYIYLPAWFGLVLGGVLMVPVGVKVSYHIPEYKLKVIFALFLFLVAIKMLMAW